MNFLCTVLLLISALCFQEIWTVKESSDVAIGSDQYKESEDESAGMAR